MMMSAKAVEEPTASTPQPPDEIVEGSRLAHAPHPSGRVRHLHAQDSDRVYQAAGNQYIIGHTLPVPAAATNTLPRDIATFTGRTEELDNLISTVTESMAASAVIPIYRISGMPGIGKTAYVVHAAHRLAKDFPDGQMFIDLHGYSAGQGPVDPAEALFSLLSVDGLPAHDIPEDVDGRAALWRARMACRRSILILDNAASYKHVEPLLPGGPGCLVLVTSRRRLTGLSARHAATTVPLSPLDAVAATDLFGQLTRRPPGEGQRRAVDELVALCGYLPLAISLLAARLGPEPRWQVEGLVAELSRAGDRLGYMRAEDIAVESAFFLSYQGLPAARRRFFRRLGLSPGPDIDAYAAAALADVELSAARRHLDALYDDHLLDQPVQGRYRLHDLLGVYARALVAKDPAWQRDQSVERLLRYYEQASAVADGHLATRPSADTARGQPRHQGTVPVLTSAREAAAWLTVELPNLLATAREAMRNRDDARLVGMSAALAAFLRRAGSYHPALNLHRAAADAAQRLGDRSARASALFHVGILLRRAGDFPGATGVLAEARGLYRDLGDRVGEADVIAGAGSVRRLAGDYPAAVETLEEALTCFQGLRDTARQAQVICELAVIRTLTEDYHAATRLLGRAIVLHEQSGDRFGQAEALLNLATLRQLTHDYEPAIHDLQQAMALYRSIGSQLGLAHAQLILGVICRLTGNLAEAAHCLDESLGVYRDAGDRLGEANALTELGTVRRLEVDYQGAARALHRALSLYRSMGIRLGQATALQELGVVQRLTGHTAEATENLTGALTVFQELKNRAGQAEVLNHIGALLLDDGDAKALDQFQAALRLACDVQSPLEEARAREGVARCLRLTDSAEAIRQAQTALDIFQKIGAAEATQASATLTSMAAET